MAKKELDSILEAERAAAEAIDSAKAQAKEILARADKEAEQLLEKAIEDAQSRAKSLLDGAAKSVVELEKKSFEEAEKEISSLRETARSRLHDAITIVTDRIKRAV